MSYQPEKNEVYYCGQCAKQYPATGATKCPICNNTMVSWYTDREKHDQVNDKWKRINGK